MLAESIVEDATLAWLESLGKWSSANGVAIKCCRSDGSIVSVTELISSLTDHCVYDNMR